MIARQCTETDGAPVATFASGRRLGEIGIPALVTAGRYDEATPAIAETLSHGLPNAELVIFEQSAHMAHAEERERYRQVLDDFLTRIETRSGGASQPNEQPSAATDVSRLAAGWSMTVSSGRRP